MKKLKIVSVGPTYPFRGGISHYNTLLCQHLAKKHDVTCVSFTRMFPEFLYPGESTRDTKSEKKISTKARTIEIMDVLNPYSWAKTALEIRKMRPGLVIFSWWSAYFSPMFSLIGWLLRKSTKAKILFICHNVTPHERRWVDVAAAKMALGNGDYFIVHSQQDLGELKAMYPRAKAAKHMHPTYGVFNYGKISAEKARKALGVKGDTILFFGFVRKYKGLEYIIRAMPAILKKRKVNLLVVGDFLELKKETEDLVRQLKIGDYVRLMDMYVPNEEVGKYVCASDALVLPYLHATNSGIAQIAFGFGKPVIATKVGGLPEVITDNVSGFIVEPQNPDALAKAVLRLYGKGMQKKLEAGVKKELYRFSWESMVEEIEKLIQK